MVFTPEQAAVAMTDVVPETVIIDVIDAQLKAACERTTAFPLRITTKDIVGDVRKIDPAYKRYSGSDVLKVIAANYQDHWYVVQGVEGNTVVWDFHKLRY